MKRGEGGIIMRSMTLVIQMMVAIMIMMLVADGADKNNIFSPCSDARIQRSDGFTFGLAFSSKESFTFNNTQLSPCDQRLALQSKQSQLALFRPKVDQISLLTINSSSFDPAAFGGHMVAFAGHKYAARSNPVLVSDSSNTITSFTLVLEFQKGTLQNMFWNNFGCDACQGESLVCLENKYCAVPNSKCRNRGGSVDCSLSIQVAFSGTDKNLRALNSWYEVKNLRQYSLYGVFSNLRDSITSPFDKLF